ncbi:hypothetical protein PFISCL1PPCAC_43, partial [Pristionchus fissidentatus]
FRMRCFLVLLVVMHTVAKLKCYGGKKTKKEGVVDKYFYPQYCEEELYACAQQIFIDSKGDYSIERGCAKYCKAYKPECETTKWDEFETVEIFCCCDGSMCNSKWGDTPAEPTSAPPIV